ncbi:MULTISPECIES: hypothetical protein [unclassified Micromonospora]|uniref:hypothetical protein n=1 Tax=unclassified Micromonospora TaxID=2617518 RepID=UPI003642E18C
MPPSAPHRPVVPRASGPSRAPGAAGSSRAPGAIALLAVLAVTLAGCGTPPELRRPGTGATGSPGPTPPASAPPTGASAPVTPPVAGPPTTPGSDLVAGPCRDGPSADRVVALLRGPSGVLSRSVAVRVGDGPLCAGDWQYTVLRVTGHEELQVISRGWPGDLELVTAGTDVCTIEVRVAGPPGIRALACDAVPGSVPVA